MVLAGDVLRVWINSSILGEEEPFYNEEFRKLAHDLGVRIETKLIPWHRCVEILVDAFRNGHSPDVFQLGTTCIRTFAYLNYLDTVPPFVEPKIILNDWMDSCLEYGGSKVAVPWFADAVAMVARKDILDKHGIKLEDLSDWDGFYKACVRLAERGRSVGEGDKYHPLVFQLRSFRNYICWFWSAGWHFPALDPAPGTVFNDEAVVGAFKYIFKLLQATGATALDIGMHPAHALEQLLTQERHVFFIGNWGEHLSFMVSNKDKVNRSDPALIFMPLPAAVPGTRSWGGGSALAVSSASNNREAAWKLVNHMTGDDFMKNWAQRSGDMPAFRSSAWDGSMHDERVQALYSIYSGSSTFPFHPMWLSIENVIRGEFADFVWQVMDGKLAATEENIREVLARTDRQISDSLEMMWEMKERE